MKYLVFILFLCCIFAGKAQSYRLKIVDPVICFDYPKNCVIVIEDSTYVLQISLQTKKVVKRPLYIDPQISFEDLRLRYESVSEPGSKVYFVDHGCGWVLQLRNDSIVRIDQSFHHQNQYGGAFFMHEGEPHVFGGYGLFSYKNLITRFDLVSGQWYLADNQSKLNLVTMEPFTISKKGFNVLMTKSKDKTNHYTEVWSYSFKTKKWKFIGSANKVTGLNLTTDVKRWNNLFFSRNKVFEVDFENQQVAKFVVFPTNTLLGIKKFNNHFVLRKQLIQHFPENRSCILEIVNSDKMKDKYFKMKFRFNIQKSNTGGSWIAILLSIIGVIVMISLIVFKFRKRPKNSKDLSGSVQELLNYWISKDGYQIELSEVNDFVNIDQPSIDTLKKRRESLLKQFVEELTFKYSLSSQDIYLNDHHPSDRRMKVLVLSDILIKRIKKEN
jgi:hypothetical protein